MSKIPYIESATAIAVQLDGNMVPVGRSHEAFDTIMQALADEDVDTLRKLLFPKVEMVKLSKGRLTLENGILTVQPTGRVLTDSVANRILELVADGHKEAEPLFNFLANLEENPDYRARNETFGFIEACKLPLTEDGCFLAYKLVNPDFTDIYTGTMDNSPGATVRMERNLVNPDKHQTCSHGLHFASLEYIQNGNYGGSSGSKLVIVKVNPRDVVSIPVDYSNSKGRACEYVVVEEVPHGTRIEVDTWGRDTNPYRDEDEGYEGYEEPEEEEEELEEEDEAEDAPVAIRSAAPGSLGRGKISEETATRFLRTLGTGVTLTAACKMHRISRRDGGRIRDREGRWANLPATV